MARIDSELVRRGLARSRGHAHDLVKAGDVRKNGETVKKVATQVDENDHLELTTDTGGYVGRGAQKLLGALDHWADLPVHGLRGLDIGACTGGFTQVLLNRGAQAVVALDVGHGQLAASLREDPRVTNIEGCNVRTLTPHTLPWLPDLVVMDISFISLTLVLDTVKQVCGPEAWVLCLVKPQFEVGKAKIGSSGVVVDPALHRKSLRKVIDAAEEAEFAVIDLCPSSLPGPGGNREYFLRLQTHGRSMVTSVGPTVDNVVTQSFAKRWPH